MVGEMFADKTCSKGKTGFIMNSHGSWQAEQAFSRLKPYGYLYAKATCHMQEVFAFLLTLLQHSSDTWNIPLWGQTFPSFFLMHPVRLLWTLCYWEMQQSDAASTSGWFIARSCGVALTPMRILSRLCKQC